MAPTSSRGGRSTFTLEILYLEPEMNPEDPTVRVTMKDIYEQLCHVEAKLDAFLAEHKGAAYPERFGDHEKRLRRVEAWLYAIPVAVVMAVANAVTVWVIKP